MKNRSLQLRKKKWRRVEPTDIYFIHIHTLRNAMARSGRKTYSFIHGGREWLRVEASGSGFIPKDYASDG